MKNNTKIIITNFNKNVNIKKKYNIDELTNLLSNIYDNNIVKKKLTHEIPPLKKMI